MGNDTRSRKQRRQLFEMYARNLGFFDAKNAGNFACPICARLFDASALNAPVRVDLAHVYPERCGGRQVTLTCKPCNSRLGTLYDSHLTRHHKILRVLNGASTETLNGRLSLKGTDSVGIDLTWTGTGYHFNCIERQSNPKTTDVIKQQFDSQSRAGGRIEPRFSVATGDPICVVASNLASAHLALFRQFGYEYLFAANVEWIREVLQRERAEDDVPVISIDIPRGGFRIVRGPIVSHHHTVGTALVNREQCLAAVFPGNHNASDGIMVLVPGFGRRATETYRRWQSIKLHGIVELEYAVWRGAPEDKLREPAGATCARRFYATAFPRGLLPSPQQQLTANDAASDDRTHVG